MDNPLIDMPGLPPFGRILPEHVEPAIDTLLARNRARIAGLAQVAEPATWENFIEPLEILGDGLERAWSPVGHLNAVMNSEALRTAYNACLPKLSDYATELGQNRALFEGYRAVAAQEHLDDTQRKLLANALRDFHLSGVDLPPDQQSRFKAIDRELSRLASKFSENLLDATNAWSKRIEDEAQLAGLPESARALARQTAERRGEPGWVLTLDFPSYQPVMTYADDPVLRREVYEAYTTRASELGPHAGQWDNGAIMAEILALRHEQAQLLGFANYAERSLATKMARSPEEVMGFLAGLAQRVVTHARQELEEVRDFARTLRGAGTLEPWDLPYYSEKLREHRYAITQEELRPYFPISRVLDGLFNLLERLFDIRIREVQGVETWHPDVRFFEIRAGDGDLRGQFYLDPFARPNKRGGAWMDVCVNRLHTATCDQIPCAYLVCNFTPPVGDQPSLLTHTEVLTLFHECGHGLHHLLTQIDYPAVGGISGVPWDAVELPSQFLENWCWERESLDLISGQVATGEPIPDGLYQRLRAAKNFQSAIQMARQLEFALFDFRIHLEYDPARGGRIQEILDQVRDQVAPLKPPAFNRFAHGFSHIFGGGYAAGYYSYKWAEVLSADAFSLFEEKGILDTATGRAFRQHILEQGGSRPAMDLYVAFRGREPTIDALLRHSGIAVAA
ncbi:MAG: M3 family metallopeptidase [Chromatiaceae bacterium]|nr:M3 family metallopeptidase [Chromatiaceae bacterium]MBP7983846.1 M3 family metallopeptidase [Chromatiaceae bacterium]